MEERRRLLNRTPTGQTSANNSSNSVSWSTRFGQGTVLLTVALERLAFYGMTGNLVLFLNEKPYQWESYNALLASLFFVGIMYLTSFLGGIVADSFLGRFKTLILSLIIYSIGYALLPVLSYHISAGQDDADHYLLPVICRNVIHNSTNGTSHMSDIHNDDSDPMQENCSATVFVVLFVIAVGAGTYRANIAPFGGDQSRGEGQNTSFFNWYYWSVNLGSLVALSVITYLQQQVSFFSGFLTAAVCLGVSFVVFLMGSCTYVYKPRTGSVVKNIVRILCEACSARKSRTSLTHRTASTDESSSLSGAHDASDPTDRPQGCLDYAKFRYGGNFNDSQVEDVKKLGKIVFVFLTLIPYWMVYFQMQTTFLIQGLHMKLNVSSVISTEEKCFHHSGSHLYENPPEKVHTDTQIVAAWFSLFDVIFVIIMIPIVDRILYPRLARSGHPVSVITRIAIGMIFAMLAMVVAGVVENFRLKSLYPFHNKPCHACIINQTIDVTTYYAADMSVFWQIPQYALIGVSEVFTCVAGIDFAYQMAPRSMKGIIMGVFYMFTGIGSFLGIAAMFCFQNVWFFKYELGNINWRKCDKSQKTILEQVHLDFYFFFLGGVALFGFIVFILVTKCFRLEQDLHDIQQQGTSQRAIPGVVDNPPSYSSVPISERNSYGRRTKVDASIQGDVSP